MVPNLLGEEFVLVRGTSLQSIKGGNALALCSRVFSADQTKTLEEKKREPASKRVIPVVYALSISPLLPVTCAVAS